MDVFGVSELVIYILAVIATIIVAIAAFRAGVFRSGSGDAGSPHINGFDFKFQELSEGIRKFAILDEGEPTSETDVKLPFKTDVRIPFETEQLARYYAQALAQSKTSFWFSLIFASIGFLIIMLAAFMYVQAEIGSSIVKFIAGLVVDAVAALFFVQSKRAQASMEEFFNKLRTDRNHIEARKLCESLETIVAKDALRTRLALHYADIENPDTISKLIMTTCLSPATQQEEDA